MREREKECVRASERECVCVVDLVMAIYINPFFTHTLMQ